MFHVIFVRELYVNSKRYIKSYIITVDQHTQLWMGGFSLEGKMYYTRDRTVHGEADFIALGRKL